MWHPIDENRGKKKTGEENPSQSQGMRVDIYGSTQEGGGMSRFSLSEDPDDHSERYVFPDEPQLSSLESLLFRTRGFVS